MNNLQRAGYFQTLAEVQAVRDDASAVSELLEQNEEIARLVFPVIVLPQKFAAPGDEFTVPVSVGNSSCQDKYLTIKFTPGGFYLDETYYLLHTYARSTRLLYIKGKVLVGADKVKLKVHTQWSNHSYDQIVTFPVRPPYPPITLTGSGKFEQGTTRLNIPTDDFIGEVSGTLTLGKTPAVNVNRAVEYLKTYPNNCLEQTISTAWPFLIVPDALAEIDPLITSDPAINEKKEAAINHIQAMQLYDGSFANWPGTNTTYNWGSVYAAHFLLTAKNNGVTFPEEMLTGVMNWMRQYLATMPSYKDFDEEIDDLTTKAYAVYVLALAGEKPLGWIEHLMYEHTGIMRPSGNIYLAGAQSLIDGNAKALREVEIGRWSGYSGRTLESDTRNIALLLGMWLDVEPQAPEVTELAQRLSAMGERGEWYSTQDNAAALVALSRYNVEAVGAVSDLQARLTTETSDTALLSYDNEAASVAVKDLPRGATLLIEAEGNGQGCYSWSITGYPKRQPKPERKNVNVESVYFDERGKVIDLSKPVPYGEVIQVVLTLKPSMTVRNVALNYLLPAGFELENPRLDDGIEPEAGTYGVVNDIRDDRLVLYFDRLSGERSYGFKMRAVTRGRFKVPQISAYGMYDAGIRFTGSVQPEVIIK